MKILLFTWFMLITSSGLLAQGLVLKHVHNSTTHQQQFFASDLEGPNTVVRDNAWDFDGDGSSDYIAKERPVGGGPLWSLKIYSAVGFIQLWSSEGELPSQTFWGTPRFYDFTGDGVKEIVYLRTVGGDSLCIYNPVTHSCILSAGPGNEQYLILDFDADNILDIGIYSSISPEQYRYEIWGAGTVQSSPPSDLVIASQNNDLILNWQPVDSCSMYRVYWSFGLNGTYAAVGTSCTPTFTHPGAAIAPLAFYRVVAITSTSEERVVGQASHRKQEN